MKSRNGLWVREFEPELLDIVTHWLNGSQLQVHPSLVTTDEGLRALLGHDRFGALLLPEVISARSRKSDGANKRCLGGGLLGGFGRVLSHALLTVWSANESVALLVYSKK